LVFSFGARGIGAMPARRYAVGDLGAAHVIESLQTVKTGTAAIDRRRCITLGG
jgi:hypothetical protein